MRLGLPVTSRCQCPGLAFQAPRRSRQRPVQRRKTGDGSRCRAFFSRFKNPLKEAEKDTSPYGSMSRDDYSEDDVEHYFNYMGMLATEGTYDRLKMMIDTGAAPVDLLLLMAASENDAPKVAELLRAGADQNAKDNNGKVASELATSEEVTELLKDPQKAFSF